MAEFLKVVGNLVHLVISYTFTPQLQFSRLVSNVDYWCHKYFLNSLLRFAKKVNATKFPGQMQFGARRLTSSLSFQMRHLAQHDTRPVGIVAMGALLVDRFLVRRECSNGFDSWTSHENFGGHTVLNIIRIAFFVYDRTVTV